MSYTEGYDFVGVRMLGGGYNLLSKEQFEQLTVAERARLILARRVQFVRDGQVISASEALGRDTWRTSLA